MSSRHLFLMHCPAPAQPEMSRNVQKYSREIYARASEAMHCRVHATLMLPLFVEPARRNVIGVLEVVQVSSPLVLSVPSRILKVLQCGQIRDAGSATVC